MLGLESRPGFRQVRAGDPVGGKVCDGEVSCCPLDWVQVSYLLASSGGIIVQRSVASGGISLYRVAA
jgi:hypothetical protein